MSIQIQAGKFYFDGTGAKVGPMKKQPEGYLFQFRGYNEEDRCSYGFREDGGFGEVGEHYKFDLVAECIDHVAECERLREVNAELCGHLSKVVKAWDEADWLDGNDFEAFRAAIARAEAGKGKG